MIFRDMVMEANIKSHEIGRVDGVSRCVNCQISAHNVWRERCWRFI